MRSRSLYYGWTIAAFGATFISISPFSAVLSRWFQKKRGLASCALGPWLGGLIFDATGSYRIALLAAMASCALSCPFARAAAPGKVRRRTSVN